MSEALAAWRFAWREGPVWTGAEGCRVVGVVNVTPDSFSDGGAHLDPERAAEAAARLVADGADAVDVGAESTRPDHAPLDVEAEWRRLAPALGRIRAAVTVPVSVDTRHAEVARRALALGAQAINDVSGLADPDMAPLAARTGTPLIVGHWRPGRAGTWRASAVWQELEASCQGLARLGLSADRVAVDPGLGFGKSAADNWRLAAGLCALSAQGRAVMVGASRKRFLLAGASAEGAIAADLDERTAAFSLWAALAGVAMVRVHAPAPTRRALSIASALRVAGAGAQWCGLPGMDE